MRPSPVHGYRQPAYPTRAMVLAEPDLLMRHLPPSWRRLAGVGGILAFFLQAEALAGEAAVPAQAGAAAVIAPIFKHGEGRGAFGCVAVSPPVFLSEEEALVVIGEELGRKGVTLARKSVLWADTPVAPRSVKDAFKAEDREKLVPIEDPASAKPLEVDAVDPAKGVAVEYISHQDYASVGGVDPYAGSTVSSYNFADAAGYLAKKAAVHHEPGKRWLGVFYDPMAREPKDAQRPQMPEGLDEKARDAWWREDWQRRQAAARVVAVEDLRLQVRDFIAWLEGQGAL